jgi:hypothetical protein
LREQPSAQPGTRARPQDLGDLASSSQFDIAMFTENETHASDAPLDDWIDVEWQVRK